MPLDLARIDAISDYDEALEALEELTSELVEELAEAPEGQALLAEHPEHADYIGSWIDHLLYFGYAYESVTLRRMTKTHVDAIVTRLFPSKITLLSPDEADTTIPELLAFWKYLKRQYKHPQATSIIKFLENIQPKFGEIMNDPKNFGMAKSFLMSGIEAGFDMSTQEGLQDFQEYYNQNLQNSPRPTPLPSLNSNASPSAMIESMGQLFSLINAANNAANFAEAGDDLEPNSSSSGLGLPSRSDFLQELRTSIWASVAESIPPLSEAAIALLQNQQITDTEPSTILKDFQTFLDFIGEGIPVSGKHNLLSLKNLAELNEKLSHPVQLDLKRPVQKSYPHINGLYLLVRTLGLGQIVAKGKQMAIALDPELLATWNSFNPTERYCTLLEAWMIRADAETLGTERNHLNEGSKCVQAWPRIPEKGQKFAKFQDQESFSRSIELHNLALLQMFGFLDITSGKPEAGKGWRIKAIQRSPFGNALMHLLLSAFLDNGLHWASETDPTIPLGELQSTLQPYFPAWQSVLTFPQAEFREGLYIFKVSVGHCWRRLAISSRATFEDLAGLILKSVQFDSDHLDMFVYKNISGRVIEIRHPYCEEPPFTNEVRVGDLPLNPGAIMTYVFDFGDWWEFQVQLEDIQDQKVKPNYQKIVEKHGVAPPQYPDWEE